MAKTVSPDKGKSIESYRDEKIASEWQRTALDQIHALIMTVLPSTKASIKWAQPVWESPEGPMIFLRSASKHLTLGFWRGAELEDATGVLEGDGDRMKHVKFKSLEGLDLALVEGFVRQAIALNAQKGNPTMVK